MTFLSLYPYSQKWGPPLTSISLKHTVDRSRRIPHSGEKIGSSASISLHNQDPNELQKRGRVEAKGESRAYSRVVQEVEANTQCCTFQDDLKTHKHL